MTTLKKKICLMLALSFIFVGVMQFSVMASGVMPRNNNTASTMTSFAITSTGDAIVLLNFGGYPNITTGATISIKIEKRVLLFFWSDIVEDTIVVNGDSYFAEHHYQLEDTGTYKCTVEYVVSGTGGADDVIPFEDTAVYE